MQVSHVLKIILKSDTFIVFKFINNSGNVRTAFYVFFKGTIVRNVLATVVTVPSGQI